MCLQESFTLFKGNNFIQEERKMITSLFRSMRTQLLMTSSVNISIIKLMITLMSLIILCLTLSFSILIIRWVFP